jgi:hypothetical protein
VAGEKFNYPPDIIAKIKQNPEAWRHFQKFPAPYKRIRVAYIEIARSRPEIFTKRLSNFLTKTEKNKIFGFAGIEKYF